MRQMTTHMSAYRKAQTTRLPTMPMGRSTDGFFTCGVSKHKLEYAQTGRENHTAEAGNHVQR